MGSEMCIRDRVAALLSWSRELPRRHHIHLSFPANRTLQKKFPRPTMTLREPEQTAWLSGSMARELDMAPDALHFDYSEDTLSSAFNVTAAQSKEISALLTLIQTLKVQVTAITPDASRPFQRKAITSPLRWDSLWGACTDDSDH